MEEIARQDFISFEGTCMLIQQRTQSLSEVVNDLLVSTRSLNDVVSSVIISKLGEELLEVAIQQMEAVKILEKGAGSLKLQCKSLMLQLQASIGTIEAMQQESVRYEGGVASVRG